jgi:hypothetical protein
MVRYSRSKRSIPPAQHTAKMHPIPVNEDRRLSHALKYFLEQKCVKGADFSITDKQLFRYFHAFWIQTPEYFDHPALLGQFRVELAQRGFLSASTGKHPRWLGLTLRKQDKKRPQKKERQ